ncbi:MAG: PspC domain-containing protein [Acidobacteria bacterium]|nr:PspC domain-containing protein [Acidobacteriota bacterium]
MTCRRCSRDIDADSAFCRHCGAPAEEPAPRRLMRLPSQGKLGGVCAGIAAHLNADPTVVRLVWAILSIVPGIIIGGLLAYAVAWVLLPVDRVDAPATTPVRRLRRSTGDRKLAGVCGGVAEYFGVDSTLVRIVAVALAIYPGAVICGVLVYVIAWFVIPIAPAAGFAPSPSTP